jgi:AraC-like DNA-binding protein/quercetin dioxygenase-like cupin family protein
MTSGLTPPTRGVTAGHCLLGDGATEGLIASYASHDFQPHYHGTWAVGIGLAGRHRLWCEGRDWIVGPGDVIVIPPGALHTGVRVGSGAWTIGMVFPEHPEIDPGASAGVLEGSRIGREFARALRRAAIERDRDGRGLLELASTLIALVAAPARSPRSGVDVRLRLARERLDAWPTGSFHVPALAAALDLHPTYLTQRFREAYGIGPYRYWLAGRVETARRSLRAGARPGDLAHALGFADQSHFTRTFRRIVGIPPGSYRDSLTRPIEGPAADAILKLF